MIGIVKTYGRRALGATLVVGVGLALSGCALGLGEFSKTAAKPVDNPYMKGAVLQEDGLPLKPAALIEEEVAPATEPTPAAAAAATVVPSIIFSAFKVD